MQVYTTTTSFNVKVGKTTKKATCDVDITYTGDTASKADSTVKCSIPWPKASALSKTITKSFTIGDVTDIVITAEVTFTLKKGKNKAASTVKTILNSITSVPFTGNSSLLKLPKQELLS